MVGRRTKPAAGPAIRYGIGEGRLGSVLVATTERGICALFLGDDSDELVKELLASFPGAEPAGSDADFEATLEQVVAWVDDPRGELELPLDLRGTPFQKRVWEALRQVPAGSTITYTELAERVGSPRGARAVAGACASNTIAMAIPCHRVLRSDGHISGFRWGVERKRALLERELEHGHAH